MAVEKMTQWGYTGPVGKGKINYGALYELLRKRPISYRDIMRITGRAKTAVPGIITTLSLKYPLYQVSHGVYALNPDPALAELEHILKSRLNRRRGRHGEK
ncbi:MAG: hypothetical protein LBP27_05820 [Treponema sp.]|jgi:hypothetical protein|nr:hypothetical protein [Treponema sp.]